MHFIQRKILIKLLYAASLSYSQLQPDGVESNHFAYHLDQLIRAGMVAKRDKQYFLAPQGLAFVDRASQEKMAKRQQPHISTVIDITNDKGQTLLYKRRFQPYMDKLGFPWGKIHLDEKLQESAARELQEKTGLQDVSLTQRGMVYVHVTQADYTITKALCHVFTGKVFGEPELHSPPSRGSCHWMDVAQLDPKEAMPGFIDIHALLRSAKPNNLFFAELSYELE